MKRVAVDPRTSDLARDTLSAFFAGLFLMVIGGAGALYRHFRDRLGRHGLEIRNIQKEAEIKPVFPEYPADKL